MSGGMTELVSPIVIKLMKAFPQSVINYNCEFIADLKTNQYFILNNCHSELDIKCKVLEWLSRAACKTQLSHSERKNRELQSEMRKHINEYLGTSFTAEDMRTIYTWLGNACNHEKTIAFINSGYDMRILEVSDNER